MNSLFFALVQALLLFALAPLLSGVSRMARARLHNRKGPGVLQEYRAERIRLGIPTNAFFNDQRDANDSDCTACSNGGITIASGG